MKKLKSFVHKYRGSLFFFVDVVYGLLGFVLPCLLISFVPEYSSALFYLASSVEVLPDWTVSFLMGFAGFGLVLSFSSLLLAISSFISERKKSRGADNG